MKKLYLLFSLFSLSLFSQNWDVFNIGYRYNYKFDNSPVISNVLFTDSVEPSGSDIIYFLNRIGVRCINNCYGITVPNNNQVKVIPNMPQFLQRKITKLSNGSVSFDDTTSMLILPMCQLNQSWSFGPGRTASCTTIGIQSVFGQPDSVKTIMIDGIDTIKLSKTFGLIVFPQPYGVNKYYRLAGIENRYSYDPNPLYGIKVLNAWDIYNFEPGDKICNTINYVERKSIDKQDIYLCTSTQLNIMSKTVTPTGYDYQVNEIRSFSESSVSSTAGCGNSNSNVIVISFSLLSSPDLVENRMYPNLLLLGGNSYTRYNLGPPYRTNFGGNWFLGNLVFVGTSAGGIQYKGMGWHCAAGVPRGLYAGLTENSPSRNYYNAGGYSNSLVFGANRGLVASGISFFEAMQSNCPSCPGPLLGIGEAGQEEQSSWYFDMSENIAHFSNVNAMSFSVANLVGQKVLMSDNVGSFVNCNALPAGIYLATLKAHEGNSQTKRIVISH